MITLGMTEAVRVTSTCILSTVLLTCTLRISATLLSLDAATADNNKRRRFTCSMPFITHLHSRLPHLSGPLPLPLSVAMFCARMMQFSRYPCWCGTGGNPWKIQTPDGLDFPWIAASAKPARSEEQTSEVPSATHIV